MSHHQRMRGVALIAVLWMVAALTIAAHSLSLALRGEIRQAGDVRQTIQASAAADGAIAQALQALALANVTSLREVRSAQYTYGGFDVAVDVVPLNGWVDLNNAPEPLLQALFQHAGGLEPAVAQQLAAAAKAYREQRGLQGRAIGFEAPEDLMAVPGVDFDLYVKIQNLVTTELSSGGGVNPLAAPEAVLRVLTHGDAAWAQQLAAARLTAGATLDVSRLPGGYVDNSAVSRVCVCAQVALPDGRMLQRGWRVALGGQPTTGLPWQALGREERLVAAHSQ